MQIKYRYAVYLAVIGSLMALTSSSFMLLGGRNFAEQLGWFLPIYVGLFAGLGAPLFAIYLPLVVDLLGWKDFGLYQLAILTAISVAVSTLYYSLFIKLYNKGSEELSFWRKFSIVTVIAINLIHATIIGLLVFSIMHIGI